MTVGLGQAWYPAWKKYKSCLIKRGVRVITLDLFSLGWASRLKKVDQKIDFYLWHADTWEENYRQIHDRIYFIEKILNKPIFPNFNQYYSYNDKIKQKEIFDYLDLPQIPTYIFNDYESAVKKVSLMTYPIIIKNAYSAAGEGLIKVDTKKEAKKIVNRIFSRGYRGIKGYLYVQKFIPNLKGDLRIITVGDKVATAYWRRSQNDWRHNISQGAKASFDNIPVSAKNFCLKISKQMNFHWLAYDLIIDQKKIKLLEWTCNFGCKAPKEIGIDMRDKLVEYALKNYHQSNDKK